MNRKIAKLELKMPKNSPWEERHRGCSTSSVVLAREKGNTKIIYLWRRRVGKKTAIHTYLCMTKYITYISTYKTSWINYQNDRIHENDLGQREIINKYNINQKEVQIQC